MCMACEEMQLFYAYLDAVEEAKRKAQPWECEVTLHPAGRRARRLPRRGSQARASAAEFRFCLRRDRMSELTALTIAAARDGLKQKKFSAAELADAHLAAIEKARSLNAYVLETPERALAMAKASDARIARGEAGPLEGIPLAIKDMFCTEGVRTTACSHILDNFVPTYESTVSAHLWRDGAVLLGKTNNDEFAMGSSNETSFMGTVTSPWRRKGSNTPLVPGGSSGGSAAAVAAHLCLGATGTDTGGSIRQPAAFTGIVGIKPTYGRCSRWGIVAFASSLDQAGPFARTVRDTAILLRSMAGHDPKDTTSVDVAGAGLRGGGRPVGQGHAHRHPEGIPDRRHAGRDRDALGAGAGVAQGRRRRAGRGVAAAHQIRAAGLLHRRAGGGLVESRALRRRALRPARAAAATSSACTRTRARTVSARRCAGAS